MTTTHDSQGDPNQDTVWVEHVSLIDSIPRWVAMLALAAIVIAIWDLATARMGWVSPIIKTDSSLELFPVSDPGSSSTTFRYLCASDSEPQTWMPFNSL